MSTTKNTFDETEIGNEESPQCPCCGQPSRSVKKEHHSRVTMYCNNANCSIGSFHVKKRETHIHINELDDEIRPLDESEYEDIQEQYNQWVVPVNPTKCHLHLHVCQKLKGRDGTIRTKPIAVYPYGYHDVCDQCTFDHRNGFIDQ